MDGHLSRYKGFTLLELMVTIAIIATLASLAIPSYLNYARRAYYSEVVAATAPYKQGVNECYQNLGTLTGCSNGQNYVPANQRTAVGAVRRIRTRNGVITVTPLASRGILTTDTYILTPTIINNTLVWTASGVGVTKGYAK